jgi:uncharacterized membrane protein YuzA (DUF378 family)
MKAVDVVAAVLVAVGGYFWGLFGFLGTASVAEALGATATPIRIATALMGLSAIYQGVVWRQIHRRWQRSRRRVLVSL